MGVRVTLFFVALTFGLTIGYSRLFLGVHSLNQLVFGWSLGLWLAFTVHFIFKDKIMENAHALLQGQETRFSKMAIRCGVLMFFAFLLQILNYAVVQDDIVNQPSWSTQI